MSNRPAWLRRPRTLSAQLLIAMVVVLVVAAGLGFALSARSVRHQLDQQYEQRALAIAGAAAAMPQIVSALSTSDRTGLEALANRVMRATGASYVVVIDRTGVRYSHPLLNQIGKRVEEPVVALDGHGHVGIDVGKTGRSANGKAPVFGANGRVVGEVSAGVPETEVSAEASNQLVNLALYLAIALGIGVAVAILLARRLKRQTFGLELDEIALLVQEREATLHGIREGIVAIDPAGRISLANDQANLLLGLTPSDIGKPVGDVLAPGDLRDRVFCAAPGDDVTDLVASHGTRLVVCSRRAVSGAGRSLGQVVTLRDRTELEHALRELDETRSLTDALRAQQHEFSNRMHVMSGLLELGHYEEAIGYAQEITSTAAGLAAELQATIDDPRLIALLVAKTTVALERGVALTVECTSRVTLDPATSDAMITVIGNLVDNAIEAVAEGGSVPAAVLVRLAMPASELVIDVVDTGPGVPDDARETIFAGGWSTKDVANGRNRGLGLLLVRQKLDALGATIEVQPDSGGHFRVHVPEARHRVTQ